MTSKTHQVFTQEALSRRIPGKNQHTLAGAQRQCLGVLSLRFGSKEHYSALKTETNNTFLSGETILKN